MAFTSPSSFVICWKTACLYLSALSSRLCFTQRNWK